jgi:hypothetical protein
MIRRAAVTVLAVVIAAFHLARRRRHRRLVDTASARELVETRLSTISERIREGGDPDDNRVRDAQAAWARDQERITADSVIAVVQRVRASIAHAGAAEARRVLDDLERQASDHPEGVPGPVVAAARLRFDELMRTNLQ